MTRMHATALGSFAFLYKSILLIIMLIRSRFYRQPTTLQQIKANQGAIDSFIAGLIGAYYVFGKTQNAVTEQIVFYVFSRASHGLFNKVANHRYRAPDPRATQAWTVFAALSWATVMALFRSNQDTVQTGMLHSMQYIFVDSELPDDDPE